MDLKLDQQLFLAILLFSATVWCGVEWPAAPFNSFVLQLLSSELFLSVMPYQGMKTETSWNSWRTKANLNSPLLSPCLLSVVGCGLWVVSVACLLCVSDLFLLLVYYVYLLCQGLFCYCALLNKELFSVFIG